MTKKTVHAMQFVGQKAVPWPFCEPNMRVVSGKTRNFVHKLIFNSLNKRK